VPDGRLRSDLGRRVVATRAALCSGGGPADAAARDGSTGVRR
jgi:hypothetical protein